MTAFPSAKSTKKKTLPPRDSSGRFIRADGSTSSEFTSGASSLLDTPEITERALIIENDASASENEVSRQLGEREDDEESLPGVPSPTLSYQR
jgi:hypothetical protein